jgi:capsular polysaccharide biosynthesis protein
MDVTGWIAALRRRWILVIVLLLPTLFAAAAIAAQPGPYQAESQVAMVPSKQSAKLTGGNPFLSFSGSILVTTDLVRREVMAPQAAQRLVARGFPGSYQVIDDPNPSAPVLDITVTGSSPGLVVQTLRAVNSTVQSTLTTVQGNVKPTDQMTSIVLSTDSQATLGIAHKARRVLAALGAGLAITIVLPLLVDAIAARRNRDADEEALPYSVARPRSPEPTLEGASRRHGR